MVNLRLLNVKLAKVYIFYQRDKFLDISVWFNTVINAKKNVLIFYHNVLSGKKPENNNGKAENGEVKKGMQKRKNRGKGQKQKAKKMKN